MAKFIMTFENSEIKKELFFNGEMYSYSMIYTDSGKQGDKPCFESQYEEKYGNDEEEVLQALSELDFANEDEIEEALAVLSEYE